MSTSKLSVQLNTVEDIGKSVRPKKLIEFIGQEDLKSNLAVYIEAAKTRNRSLDHLLLYGPPGLGKTTLAEIIANELGTNLRITSGPILTKPGDLAAILSSLKENDVLFIDEIHRLCISAEEVLYSAMEDFKLDIILGEGPAANNVRIDLPRFTLVGATTRQGLLSNPLRDRFGINLRLVFYSNTELQEVLSRHAKIKSVEITSDASAEIAKRARGTPRIANNLFNRMCDFLITSTKGVIDKELVMFALERLGIDNFGLDAMDKRYLCAIAEFYKGGPVGVETLAAVLSENKGTIEDVIEPYLLKEGLLIRTPRGRCITDKSWVYLGKQPPNKGGLL